MISVSFLHIFESQSVAIFRWFPDRTIVVVFSAATIVIFGASAI